MPPDTLTALDVLEEVAPSRPALIALYGKAGSGKSTLAFELAAHYQKPRRPKLKRRRCPRCPETWHYWFQVCPLRQELGAARASSARYLAAVAVRRHGEA